MTLQILCLCHSGRNSAGHFQNRKKGRLKHFSDDLFDKQGTRIMRCLLVVAGTWLRS